jgi:dTDP-4-dehydrorhamnose reductase
MIIETKPDIVINAAAERRPDVCEADDLGSESLNIESVWHLGRTASYVGSKFIHISTDYIFDGTEAPYKEDAKPHPLNAYGRQKLRGEYAALAAHANALILRLPVLFGPTRDVSESAITVFANAVRDIKTPKVLDDWQIRVPTYTPDIAATLLNICDALTKESIPAESLSGIFHYSSEDCLTRYKVAQLIGDILGLPIDHISSDPNPPAGAPRPKDAKLNTYKLRTLGLAAPCTNLKTALEEVLKSAEDGMSAT